MKKILVIGGSGFVGSNLIESLIKEKEYKIFSTIFKKKKIKKFKNVRYFSGDLQNQKYCDKITKKKDIVVMCAAFTAGAKIIEKNPLEFVTVNTKINLNVLNSCKKNKIKKFIFLSSSVVYPNKITPMKEKDVNYTFFKKYQNVAWMKLYTEKVCEMYNKFFNVLILRPSNLYGPYDKFDKQNSKVIPSLIRKFNNEKKIEIWGDGKDIKDFLYIKDFIKILILLIKIKEKFLILNVGSGKSVSLMNIISIINKYYVNKNFYFKKNSPKMIPVRKINIDKLKKILNFKLKYSLAQGLKDTILWYKKNN
jgi:GDP-L-fucose synthase